MTEYATVRDTVAEICRQVMVAEMPGIRIYPTGWDSSTVPALVIRPGVTDKPHVGLSSRSSRWDIEVQLLLGKVNDRAAKQRAEELIMPGSSLRLALRHIRVAKGFLITHSAVAAPQKQGRRTYEGGLIKLKGMA